MHISLKRIIKWIFLVQALRLRNRTPQSPTKSLCASPYFSAIIYDSELVSPLFAVLSGHYYPFVYPEPLHYLVVIAFKFYLSENISLLNICSSFSNFLWYIRVMFYISHSAHTLDLSRLHKLEPKHWIIIYIIHITRKCQAVYPKCTNVLSP